MKLWTFWEGGRFFWVAVIGALVFVGFAGAFGAFSVWDGSILFVSSFFVCCFVFFFGGVGTGGGCTRGGLVCHC